MYIPYEIIGNFISYFCKNKNIRDFFYDKKIAQNLEYIKRNKPKVLNKISQKLKKNEKINVVFYVYDFSKWKCKYVYDIFSQDKRFNVTILVTKSGAKNKNNPSYQSANDVKKNYEYFKQKGYNTKPAYDINKSKFIPFKKFSPDIIFYQHPWYVETSQGPVVCSEFALTAYIPYYFQMEVDDIDNKIDYYLRFHSYVEKYYVLDSQIENKFKEKMENKGKNVVVTGYPYLDYFKENQENGEYIIYAPHWTVNGIGLKYGTFQDNGQFMLDFAKSHPEQKWIFKPHSLLKKSLFDTGLMSKEEIENYYNEWKKIGIVYEGCEYLEYFKKSKLMITDSCSFYGEYFVTQKPLIMLLSDLSPFKSRKNPILESYYYAFNTDELKNLINKIPENDYLKEKRINLLKNMKMLNNNASQNILHDILKEIGEYNGQ